MKKNLKLKTQNVKLQQKTEKNNPLNFFLKFLALTFKF